MSQEMTFALRSMTESDLPSGVSVLETCFAKPPSKEWCEEFLATAGNLGMVAELDAHVIGLMLYQSDASGLHLAILAVTPRLQKRGYGTRMIEWLKREALPHHQTIQVHVYSDDKDALRLYLASGFEEVSTFLNPDDRTSTVVLKSEGGPSQWF